MRKYFVTQPSDFFKPCEQSCGIRKGQKRRGGGRVVTTPFADFSLSPQNQKEIDQDNLFYILCGHFDENKLGVAPYPGLG